MSLSREKMLNSIRNALADQSEDLQPDLTRGQNPDDQRASVNREYRIKSDMKREECVRLFTKHVLEYKANVTRVSESEIANSILEICAAENVRKLVIPSGINKNWLPEDDSGLQLLMDEPTLLSNDELDRSDAVLTGCFRAIAQTGTIVLNGGAGQGRRKLTLIPDFHICVVLAGQIRGIVPEVFSDLDTMMKESGPQVTFISGPSATSDIELSRVEGVHGPRRLHVLIAWM